MSFILDTFGRATFKRLLGKAHTSNSRDPANEPIASTFTLSAQNIWAEPIHPTPGHSSNAGVVSGQVTLNLEPVSGTANSGKFASYRLKLGSVVPATLAGKINRQTGAPYAPNDYVGDIIPQSFGNAYIPLLFENGNQVFPLDASDWYLDSSAGVITQEEDSPSLMRDYSTNGTLQCYIYIGKTVAEQIAGIETGVSNGVVTFYDDQTVGNGVSGAIDGMNNVFELDHTPDPGSLKMYINGVKTRDFTLSGNEVTVGANTVSIMSDPETELFFEYRVTGS